MQWQPAGGPDIGLLQSHRLNRNRRGTDIAARNDLPFRQHCRM
jgi:hypothetical protein